MKIAKIIIIAMLVLAGATMCCGCKNSNKTDEITPQKDENVKSFLEELSVEKNITDKYSDDSKEDIGNFSASIMKRIFEKDCNMCFSPVGMYESLTLLAECCEGNSQTEILEALGADDISVIENNYMKINESIKTADWGEKAKTILENSVWLYANEVDDTSKEIFDDCQSKLNAKVSIELFENSDINEWVTDKTNGKIKNLVDESVQCEFAIINAFYHNSKWTSSFEKCGYDDFSLNGNEKLKTEFMEWKCSSAPYICGDEYAAVVIEAKSVNMIFVNPNEGTELASLMDEKILNELLASTESKNITERAEVELRVPLFNYEYSMDSEKSKDVFEEMGISDIFDKPDWKISVANKLNIIQKTKIAIDENGIEAASGTGVMATFSKGDGCIRMKLDKPFMWIIEKDGYPLMMGTVYNPAE